MDLSWEKPAEIREWISSPIEDVTSFYFTVKFKRDATYPVYDPLRKRDIKSLNLMSQVDVQRLVTHDDGTEEWRPFTSFPPSMYCSRQFIGMSKSTWRLVVYSEPEFAEYDAEETQTKTDVPYRLHFASGPTWSDPENLIPFSPSSFDDLPGSKDQFSEFYQVPDDIQLTLTCEEHEYDDAKCFYMIVPEQLKKTVNKMYAVGLPVQQVAVSTFYADDYFYDEKDPTAPPVLKRGKFTVYKIGSDNMMPGTQVTFTAKP